MLFKFSCAYFLLCVGFLGFLLAVHVKTMYIYICCLSVMLLARQYIKLCMFISYCGVDPGVLNLSTATLYVFCGYDLYVKE